MIDTKRRIAVLCWLIGLANGEIINSLYFQIPHSANKGTNELELIRDEDNKTSFQSVDRNAIRNSRLSEADWSWYNIKEPNGAGTYAFGYDNAVDPEGNEHYRSEERLENGTIIGEYGYTDYQNHRKVKVTYVADSRGYRVNTQIVPIRNLLSRIL